MPSQEPTNSHRLIIDETAGEQSSAEDMQGDDDPFAPSFKWTPRKGLTREQAYRVLAGQPPGPAYKDHPVPTKPLPPRTDDDPSKDRLSTRAPLARTAPVPEIRPVPENQPEPDADGLVRAADAALASPVGDWSAERGWLVACGNALLDAVRRHAGSPMVPAYLRRLTAVQERYLGLLPPRALARCPYTDKLVTWNIDDGGLDGPFWRYRGPVRRMPVAPPTWFAMTGAVRLELPLALAPFESRPGPDAPFVVPRLLAAAGSRAVLAQASIGRQLAWVITYFGTRPPSEYLVGLWGAAECPLADGAGGWPGLVTAAETVDDYDFDLTPWLESGQLRWIAPGDVDLRLRGGVNDCPYLDLPSSRRLQIIENGTARHA